MTERFLVQGGARLDGKIHVAGAKNSVLKLMAASLLAEGTTVLHNIPHILDVPMMNQVLEDLGCSVSYDEDAATVEITVPPMPDHHADSKAVRQFRASVCVLGPLIARTGRAVVALPGGDAIGSRPLDMHQSGLESLGASTHIEHGCLVAETTAPLVGATIELEFPSVGATENIITAAVLAKGTTQLINAAREPEIVDICTMLNAMGAKITGAGENVITVEGVERLHPTEHSVVGDRIVAATWAFAATMTQGDITVSGISPMALQVVLMKLEQAGAEVERHANGFRVIQRERPTAVNFQTLPFPGFPTDLQPMAIGMTAVADGVSMITENVFEARFRFVDEMVRLGAQATIDGHHCHVTGVKELSSAPVWSSDIRAGAGLVLAGLCADGETEVHDIYHIDRGYPSFVDNLRALGADVRRVDDNGNDVAEPEVLSPLG